jgi:hypothetical protein
VNFSARFLPRVLIVVLVAIAEDVAIALGSLTVEMDLGCPAMVLAIVSVTVLLIIASSMMDTVRPLALTTVMASVRSITAIKADAGAGAVTREIAELQPTLLLTMKVTTMHMRS